MQLPRLRMPLIRYVSLFLLFLFFFFSFFFFSLFFPFISSFVFFLGFLLFPPLPFFFLFFIFLCRVDRRGFFFNLTFFSVHSHRAVSGGYLCLKCGQVSSTSSQLVAHEQLCMVSPVGMLGSAASHGGNIASTPTSNNYMAPPNMKPVVPFMSNQFSMGGSPPTMSYPSLPQYQMQQYQLQMQQQLLEASRGRSEKGQKRGTK